MTSKQFLNSLAKGESDILRLLLGILADTGTNYCLIGGLAVNAYVEPVVSLDIDIVIAVDNLAALVRAAKKQNMLVEEHPHSINISASGSDLRIQVQTDPRYQAFIAGAEFREVLGYKMKIAPLDKVLQGKVWACLDAARRMSKRQKDLADIMRIIEAYPELAASLPERLKEKTRE